MAPQVTIFFHKIETTKNACTKRVGFKKTFIVGESLFNCIVPKPIQRAKPQVTPKVVKTQLKKTLSKNALRNARKRAARALRKKEAKSQSIKAILSELSRTSSMVTASEKTASTLAVLTPKRTSATRFVQIMIGSIPVNLYPTDSALMTSIDETSDESQEDDSQENIEVQEAEPSSSPRAHVVESTLQEVYPCSHKGKSKAIIMKKKVVNIPHPQRKRVKTVVASKGQILIPQGAVPKPQDQSRSYVGPLTRYKSRDMMGMIVPELSSLNSARLDDYLQWNPLYDDPVSQTQENDCIASQGTKLHEGVESMQVMMTGSSNTEDQLPLIQEMMQDLRREMQQKLAEKDAEIALLSARLKGKDVIDEQDRGKTNESVTPEQQTKEEKAESSTSTISPNDIKALIAEGIREFQLSIAPPVQGYRKPFPSHYDAIPFPKGYQRPIFDKFDGISSSPHEHLAHFYSACGETSQSDALLVRQFVQSLKGSAFTWYTQLPPGSILTWDDMQKAFLAQFVSSKKKVSIMDLAQTTQKPGKNANDFIMRWRSLNLQCPEKITEQSAVQMCYNNLIPDIATFVAIAEPQSFDALVSKASNVERQIARQKSASQKNQFREKKNDKKSAKGESLATFVKTEKKNDKGQSKDPPKRLTLKERKKVKYSFDDEDVEEIFDQLLASKGITLPESKRPAEANKTNDPKYCRYHRLISHTLKDCYILKDKIQELLNNGGLVIDSSSQHHSATANMIEEKLTFTTALLSEVKFAGTNTDNGGTIVHACPKAPWFSDLQIPTLHELMVAPSLEIWEDSSANESAEGWKTFVKRAKHMAKHFPPNHKSVTHPGVKIRGMPTLKNKRKKKRVQKKVQIPQEYEYEQPGTKQALSRGGSDSGIRGRGDGRRCGRGGGRFNGGIGGMMGGKRVVVVPHGHKGVFIAKGKEEHLLTKSLVPREAVYNEKRISVKNEDGTKDQYRIWNPFCSKLAAAIRIGVYDISIMHGTRVLYLGAASGTTVSHVSDIVGLTGFVFAVEFSHRSGRDLINMAMTRRNVIPIIEDAKHPAKYRMLVGMVDVIFFDVAQPDQGRILALNASHFLKAGGHFIMSIEANCIESTVSAETLYKSEMKRLEADEFDPLERVSLEPYEHDHHFVFGSYCVP
ncbi:unnamed protein product [Prunus armeniaca]|uniref:Retrotransposon gag domain-containing protein n=1 Tax=Prunus armeniaca TaxID=36596 RepID=A0A6J5Y753_PRUAR|nr:unnamed protein product [Prunus armeniaca]